MNIFVFVVVNIFNQSTKYPLVYPNILQARRLPTIIGLFWNMVGIGRLPPKETNIQHHHLA